VGAVHGVNNVVRAIRYIEHHHGYARHDYEEIDADAANELIARLRTILADLPGRERNSYRIIIADDFAYTDPVDGSVSRHQGIRILFQNDSRIVFRLSGTGTAGATLRVYLERYEPNPTLHGLDSRAALADLAKIADEIAEIHLRTGRSAPSVVT